MTRPTFDGTVRVARISFAVDDDTVRFRDGSPKANWQWTVARFLQGQANLPDSPLDCGLSFGYGVGEWGVEECVHVETATPIDFTGWLYYVLRHFRQQCAYVCFDGCEAWEFNAESAEWKPITGKVS